MLKIEFYGICEVRMGSSYHLCRLRTSGDWVPDLPDTDWQNKVAYHNDGEAVALVRWDTPENRPGFRIVVVDSGKRTVEISDRFEGCCDGLAWGGDDQVLWRAFPKSSGIYKLRSGRNQNE